MKTLINSIRCNKYGLFLLAFLSVALFAHSPQDFCFLKISEQEKQQPWAQEYAIGISLASLNDYPAAIQCFKRALILASDAPKRTAEIEYAIVLSYYQAKEYLKALDFFEKHSLLYISNTFPAYEDLMRLLHHSYAQVGQFKKVALLEKHLENLNLNDLKETQLVAALLKRDMSRIQTLSTDLDSGHWVSELTQTILQKQKSRAIAKWLNALIPGSGYFYVGLYKAAISALIINVLLFIGAFQLFKKKLYTLGALVAIFAVGWYAGGIMGMDGMVHQHNEALFANYADKIFFQHRLNPEEKLHYAF